ncbi:hypothetical protein [Pseudocnuella soli]|uniref:hypothetical protein n=1 Tax=Pseudocnuella soli TaxID=2502779 RepID=UPI001047769E|nr:hypothetical protein [Pseudocnuella soli]
MTLQSFKSLSPKQKRRALLHKGIYLAERTTASFSVFLFKVEDFFVELFFIRENDEIAGLRPVQEPKVVRHYNLGKQSSMALTH